MTYRPIPGKFTVDAALRRIVRVRSYGRDAAGEYVEVRCAGSYGATYRLPLSCIRPLTVADRAELGERSYRR